jgi:hypothetical protein
MLGETGSTCPARDDMRSIPEIPGSQLIVIDPVLNWCEQTNALIEQGSQPREIDTDKRRSDHFVIYLEPPDSFQGPNLRCVQGSSFIFSPTACVEHGDYH